MNYVKVSTHFYSMHDALKYLHHITANPHQTYKPLLFKCPHGNGGIFFIGRVATEDDLAFLPLSYRIDTSKHLRVKVSLSTS